MNSDEDVGAVNHWQNWSWRVVVRMADRHGKQILASRAPHRAAAKTDVRDRIEGGGGTVTEWVDTYIPRASWDCPECGTHEGLMHQPNLRGEHDWECMICGLRTWGEPMEWDKIDTSRVSDRYLKRRDVDV